jgi:hypothetical protein
MSKEVRIAIAGLGSCANPLIQGVEYYPDSDPSLKVPGLMHIDLGGCHQVLRTGRVRRGRGIRQRYPRVHRVGSGVGTEVRRCQSADRR